MSEVNRHSNYSVQEDFNHMEDDIALGPRPPDTHIVTQGAEANLSTDNHSASSNSDITDITDTASAGYESRPIGGAIGTSCRSKDANQQVDVRFADLKTRYQSFFCDENKEFKENSCRQKFALAGFFFYGRGRHTQCFRCKLIIPNLKSHHDPVVMHAHLGNDCEYLRLQYGQAFLDAVKRFSQITNIEQVTETFILGYMEASGILIDRRNEDVLTQAAITTIHEFGFSMNQILQAVANLYRQNELVSAMNIFRQLSSAKPINQEINWTDGRYSGIQESVCAAVSETGMHQQLLRHSRSNRDSLTCVICQEKAVEILIRPCDHVVLCIDCSLSLEICPCCQETISSRERIYISC